MPTSHNGFIPWVRDGKGFIVLLDITDGREWTGPESFYIQHPEDFLNLTEKERRNFLDTVPEGLQNLFLDEIKFAAEKLTDPLEKAEVSRQAEDLRPMYTRLGPAKQVATAPPEAAQQVLTEPVIEKLPERQPVHFTPVVHRNDLTLQGVLNYNGYHRENESGIVTLIPLVPELRSQPKKADVGDEEICFRTCGLSCCVGWDREISPNMRWSASGYTYMPEHQC